MDQFKDCFENTHTRADVLFVINKFCFDIITNFHGAITKWTTYTLLRSESREESFESTRLIFTRSLLGRNQLTTAGRK